MRALLVGKQHLTSFYYIWIGEGDPVSDIMDNRWFKYKSIDYPISVIERIPFKVYTSVAKLPIHCVVADIFIEELLTSEVPELREWATKQLEKA